MYLLVVTVHAAKIHNQAAATRHVTASTTELCSALKGMFPARSADSKQLRWVIRQLGLQKKTNSTYPSREELFRTLYHDSKSPYVGLQPAPAFVQGSGRRLGSASKARVALEANIRAALGRSPHFVVEVGSFLGAGASKAWGPMVAQSQGLVLCVDTWQGDVPMRLGPNFRSFIQLKNGFSELGRTFMSNMLQAGMENTVFPLSMPSLTAARLLAVLQWKIDVVSVDSAHEQGETLIELFMYWQLLRPGGVLTGDDWLEFPAVKHDVSLFALCVNQSLHLLKDDDSERTNTWMLVKK